MQKLKRSFYSAWLLTCLCFMALAQLSTIPLDFFGVNGWMNTKIGNATNNYDCPGLVGTYSNSPSPCYLNGSFDGNILTNCPGKITGAYAKLIRYGGAAPDKNPPTWDQYLLEIDRIRNLGAEPLLEIPWSFSSTQANDLLTFINVTSGRKVKYFSIGNEPDKYSNYPSSGKAAFIASTYTAVVPGLKQIDNSIQIVGPSLASYDATVYQGLLTGTNSIAGTDGNGHYYLDIVDFHYYPFDGNTATQTTVAVQGNPEGSLKTILTNTSTNTGVVDLITTANSSRSSSPLKFSISEMNIDWKIRLRTAQPI